MKLTRLVVAGLFTVTVATGATAQTLRQNPQPAELPPAGFTGNQYVDSQGCVFIRAGVNGAVTWVPRVSRDRRLVCGAQPTGGAGSSAVAAATPARSTSAPPPVQIVPDIQPVQAAQVQVAPRVTAPRPAAPAVTYRPPMPTVATGIVRPAAPLVVTKPSAAPRPTGAPVVRSFGGNCPNATEFSNRYVNDGSRGPVRCGPQQMVRQSSSLGGGGSIAAGGERIVPAHVYANRFNTQNVVVPQGYAPVWDDDRLNPRRAEQSVAGFYQTQEIWTNTVPRRLVKSSREPRIKDPIIVGRAEAGVTRSEAPVISTRSSAKAVAPQATAPRATATTSPVPAATRALYVQVGMFGVAANAQATAQRLAGSGLPVRLGQVTRSGAAYQTVMAGPFASAGDAQQALSAARRLGFADAYIR